MHTLLISDGKGKLFPSPFSPEGKLFSREITGNRLVIISVNEIQIEKLEKETKLDTGWLRSRSWIPLLLNKFLFQLIFMIMKLPNFFWRMGDLQTWSLDKVATLFGKGLVSFFKETFCLEGSCKCPYSIELFFFSACGTSWDNFELVDIHHLPVCLVAKKMGKFSFFVSYCDHVNVFIIITIMMMARMMVAVFCDGATTLEEKI